LNRKQFIACERATLSLVITRRRVCAMRRPMTGSSGRSSIPDTSAVATLPYSLLSWPHCIASLPERPRGEKPAEIRASACNAEASQLFPARQTRNFDLSGTKSQSKHFSKVHSMD
jgi:hypothetical protein